MRRTNLLWAATLALAAAPPSRAAEYPRPTPGDFTVRDFKFACGDSLPEVRLHYRTLGKPRRDGKGVVTNAVLVLHGTTGSGENFIRPEFAGELFGRRQPLDAERYYLILPDGVGHGRSSKPSDGLRGRFPRYGYRDMVALQRRLVTDGLGVNHLRLVMGTSMGGMHTWVWGETYPDFVDALLPLASLPTQISGRNRMWRRMVIDAIRTDPGWNGGDYAAQPHGLRFALGMLAFVSSSPVERQKNAPTREAADRLLEDFIARSQRTADANDVAYAVDASWDYDPGPALGAIRAPLLAVNFADDLINPPELGILEREIKQVPRGQAVVIPAGPRTRGHGTHTLAAVWKDRLVALLNASER